MSMTLESSRLMDMLEKDTIDTQRGVRRSLNRCLDELSCYMDGVPTDGDAQAELNAAIYRFVLACRVRATTPAA